MARNVDDKIKKLNPTQRKKVEARAAELITEEMILPGRAAAPASAGRVPSY